MRPIGSQQRWRWRGVPTEEAEEVSGADWGRWVGPEAVRDAHFLAVDYLGRVGKARGPPLVAPTDVAEIPIPQVTPVARLNAYLRREDCQLGR